MEIPLNVQVECEDGPCGKTFAIIADPETRSVTHVVIESPGLEARLVPLDLVAETTHDLVRLRCSQAELAEMEQFIETHYVDKAGGDYAGASFGADPYAFEATYASYTPETVPVEEERIPPGELAFHRGADVEATDGHIGKVGEFVIEEESGHVSHLVLMEGHLWGKKEVTLPLSAIDHAEADTVYLKLDKRAVKELPAVRVKRRHHKD